jgi:hypothetical protein
MICSVTLASWDGNVLEESHLDNLVPRERQKWNVSSIASHQIAIQHSQNTFVGYDQEVILLALKLENNRL